MALIEFDNLTVTFRSKGREVRAVEGVSLSVDAHESYGLVGESGSGKSTLGRALLKLLPTADITADRMQFRDVDLLATPEKRMLGIRGKRISMILQDPKFSLNPIQRVGHQVAETLLRHFPVSKSDARAKTLEMLAAVKIRDPERVHDLYPNEISGGMGQRVMIAMMLLADPDLVIADEPTSALDVTVRLQVLNILDGLVRDRGIGLIMISHDLNLVRNFCDRVLIMYAGRVVETLNARDMDHAQHPYTRGLLAAQPRIGGSRAPLAVLDRRPEWKEEART